MQTESGNPAHPSRREFLRFLGAGFLASYTVLAATDADAMGSGSHVFRINSADSDGASFPQSVASGDPTASGFILWTRLTPALVTGNDVLGLEIALDADFTQVELRVRIPAAQISSALDYTLRVDLDGKLKANTTYYYRFIYLNVSSRTGRARTLPHKNDETFHSLKLAVVNCQDYTNGYYGSYNFIANDPSIDFVLHVGDFIYETTSNTSFQGAQNRPITLPSGSTVALGLDDYRALYQTYRSDAYLRAALENYTWMIMWDDHEMANDQYHDYVNDSAGAPDHPFTTEANAANLLRQLKFDSQQSWFEYTAVRATLNESAADIFGRLQIYRNFRFGTLVEFFLTDERTYRSPHPEGENLPGIPDGFGARYLAPDLPQTDTTRVMLGDTQREAFVSGVIGSGAQWKAWANEVLLAPLQIQVSNELLSVLPATLAGLLAESPGVGGIATVDNDSWDGYQIERTKILSALAGAGVQNFVILTGDLHTYVASYAKADYTDPDNTNAANVVGVEYMTPAITSSNLQEQLGLSNQAEGGLELLAVGTNKHLVYLNSHEYGYATVTFTRKHCVYTMYVVDKNDPNPATALIVRKFRTPAGEAKIEDITNTVPADEQALD
jgi:alkaline phosphatase D